MISSSIGGAAVIYLLIGLLGYVTFGNGVGSNILDSYHGGLLISTCRVAISILVLFSCASKIPHHLTTTQTLFSCILAAPRCSRSSREKAEATKKQAH